MKVEIQNFGANTSFWGMKGDEGLSAYEVAVKHGYLGSESDWVEIVTSLGELELDNVDNTRDIDKPVSLPTQAVLSDINTLTMLSLLKASKKKTAEKPLLTPDTLPLYCFSVKNDSSPTHNRQTVSCLYPDGFFNQNRDVAFSGGKGFFPINNVVAGIQKIKFSSSTWTVKDVDVNNFVVPLSSVTTKISLINVGDSINDTPVLNPDGSYAEYWSATSKALLNNLKDNIDKQTVPKMVMLGHRNYLSKTASYKNNNLVVAGGTAAMAGWSAASTALHAIPLQGFDTGNAGFVPPDVSYYLLGLQGQTGSAYNSANLNHETLIYTTMTGKNTIDKNVTVYNWMKTQVGWIGANDTYTNTTTQNNNITNFWETLLDNPQNEWFSKTKARTANATCAFSPNAYLGRRKTHANDGVTPLIIGSTAGTKVVNGDAYTVYLPNFWKINLGENDFYRFQNVTNAQIATTVRLIADAILAEYVSSSYPTPKILITINPRPGTNFPELFPAGIRYTKSDPNLRKVGIRNAIIANLGVTSTNPKTGNIYYLDLFPYMYPLSHQYDQSGESAGQKIDVEENTVSTVHPGLYAHASMGDLELAAYYYMTLN